MKVLYFSKLNVNSHIFEVYKAKVPSERLKEVLTDIYLVFKDGLSYTFDKIKYDDEGNKHVENIKYEFVGIEFFRDDLNFTVTGKLVKRMTIFINRLEEDGTITKVPIKNDEVVDFFFDVEKEIIAYYTAQRLGYVEFNKAFENILNDALMNHKNRYHVKIENLKEGLSIDNLKQRLKEIGKLSELVIDVIPPNMEDDRLDGIKDKLKNRLKELEDANVTERTVIYKSSAAAGLEIDKPMIREELDSIEDIHTELSSEDAIRNGYVTVQGTNTNGITFSTKETKPKTADIENPNSLIEFARVCKEKISSVLRR